MALLCVNSRAPSTPLRSAQDDGVLFRSGQRFVEPRFATIGCVSMDDSAFGSFIDRGNGCSDLLRAGFFGRTQLALDGAQSRHHAAITQRSF